MAGMTPADRMRVRMVDNHLRLIGEHLESMQRDVHGLEYMPWKREVDDLWKRSSSRSASWRSRPSAGRWRPCASPGRPTSPITGCADPNRPAWRMLSRRTARISVMATAVLALACGFTESEVEPIPHIRDWPCSIELENGLIVYPTLVNEAKKYALPFSIGTNWRTGGSSKLTSDRRYPVTFGFDIVDVDHEIEGLLDPVTCEMTPTTIRKYNRYYKVIDQIDLQ